MKSGRIDSADDEDWRRETSPSPTHLSATQHIATRYRAALYRIAVQRIGLYKTGMEPPATTAKSVAKSAAKVSPDALDPLLR